MSDVRNEYGHPDPWEGVEDAAFAGDHIYGGDHELIEDLVLLTEVVLDFEHWADDFRYWDERSTKFVNWEENSPFSELTSIKLSNKEVEEL